jgi:hypothetical protein
MQDETEWVILDTETDGLDYPIHAIEIAAQRMRGMEKRGDPFRVFLNHHTPIPPSVTAIHGYDREFLQMSGIDPTEAYRQLRFYVDNRPVAAHFLRYDWNAVLLPEWRRLGLSQIGQPGLCTWNLSRRVLPECRSHRLDLLREIFGLPTAGAHSAKGDVETVFQLLKQSIFPRLQQVGVVGFNDVLRFSLEKPLLKCHCLIQGRDYAAEVQKLQEERKDRKERQRLIDAIRGGEVPDVPGFLRSRDFVASDPEITFSGHTFLFTGKMVWGSRSNATRLVESVGGVVSTSKTITSGIDYLVLGEDLEKGWTALLHGGKLVVAVCHKIADEESRLCIVVESDFIDCLMGKLQESGQSECSLQCDPATVPMKTKSKIPPAQLTEVTIGNTTRTGDTPLHRAAKTGRFGVIPSHLLKLELFLQRNDREETPLHTAARHGHLSRVPSEFLTVETLTALDSYGRTPLHIAADYRHVDQIPEAYFTPELLSLPTKNSGSQTILHLAAATNTLSLIPEKPITPELLQIKNGQGLTPLQMLQAYVAAEDQLTGFRSIGLTNAETSPVVINGVEYRSLYEANAHIRQEAERRLDESSPPQKVPPPGT